MQSLAFSWLSSRRGIPLRWDLRRAGWQYLATLDELDGERLAVVLVDGRHSLTSPQISGLGARFSRSVLMVVGIPESSVRSRLLDEGFGEALPTEIGFCELVRRARRVAQAGRNLPRSMQIGALSLDLFHRDVRVGSRWLGLHPREFALLWRLAETPDRRVSRRDLLRDVWRLQHDPGTNSLEVHVSRLRTKLAVAGQEAMLVTDPDGGYRLETRGLALHGAEKG